MADVNVSSAGFSKYDVLILWDIAPQVLHSHMPRTHKPRSGHVSSWGMQLWLHAQQGHCAEVERLLQEQEAAAAAGGEGAIDGPKVVARALHVSVFNDHVDTAAVLMARAPRLVQLHRRGCGGFQHVHLAAGFGSCDTLRFLLAMKADAEAKSTDGPGTTPLVLAAERGHLGAVHLLLAHRVLVDACDVYRRTALMMAAEQGYVAVAQLLLKHEAHVDRRDCDGVTPLLCAAVGGSVETVALLLCSKAQADATDNTGNTPLAFAASGAHCDVAALLLHHRAAVDPVSSYDTEEQTPLHVACYRGDVDMATLLLDRKASLERATSRGRTPLACAVRTNRLAVAALLLRRGANLERTACHGRTPLTELCTRLPSSVHSLRIRSITAEQETQERLVMAQFLIDAKASVDAIDARIATPLALAIRSGSVAIASIVRSRSSGP